MRVGCGELDPGAVIRPVVGEWQPRMPDRLDDEGEAVPRRGHIGFCTPSSRHRAATELALSGVEPQEAEGWE
jgi:hypothetical protein